MLMHLLRVVTGVSCRAMSVIKDMHILKDVVIMGDKEKLVEVEGLPNIDFGALLKWMASRTTVDLSMEGTSIVISIKIKVI